MDNLINMSDHEKVIFVTGIDESRNTELSGDYEIASLAENYPFAVFFTTNDKDSGDYNYPVMNIWKGANINGRIRGVRLTRFVGIDEENNELQIGDHTVKLLFDYNTGKIGLYDANKLDRLEIVSIGYTNLSGTRVTVMSDIAEINAKDNKFNLTIRYVSSSGEAKNISNIINIDTSDFTLLSKNKLLNTYIENEEETSINNEYLFQIKNDTYKDYSNVKYEITSGYSSDKYVTPILTLILNPIQYEMTYNNSLLGSIIYDIGPNQHAKINVNFEPSNVTSYPERGLYLKVISKDTNYITLEGETEKLIEINNGGCSFYLDTIEQVINNDISVILEFEIWYKKNNDIYRKYDYLSSSKTVILKGTYSDSFWYAGYDNPFEIDVTDKLIPFDSINAGTAILYDWNDPAKSLGLADENNKFYIAIPYSYKDIIKPRWDAWIIDNGTIYYEDCSKGWFIQKSDKKIIKNIEFIVYESKFIGKFYGKIQ